MYNPISLMLDTVRILLFCEIASNDFGNQSFRIAEVFDKSNYAHHLTYFMFIFPNRDLLFIFLSYHAISDREHLTAFDTYHLNRCTQNCHFFTEFRRCERQG